MALTLSGTNKIVNDNLNTEVKTLFTPKNWIINGGFDVWQRGTSQTSSGYGSDDRFVNEHAGSTKTHSQQAFTLGQADVPNNPTYFSRTVVTSANTAGSLVLKFQRIEDVKKLAGKTITLSFWAKADASKNMSINFFQNFGSGGSTAVDGIGVQKFALTTSWQRFTKTLTLPSISGKTVGADNYTRLAFWFDAGSNYASTTDSLGNQSGTFDIANVSLVEGSVPIEWQTEAYADVLRQCQRYYWRVGGIAGNPRFANGLAMNSTTGQLGISMQVPMRVTPTSVEYISIYMWDGQNIHSCSALLIGVSTSNFTIIETTTTGLSFGRAYMGLTFGGTGSYIALNAEL